MITMAHSEFAKQYEEDLSAAPILIGSLEALDTQSLEGRLHEVLEGLHIINVMLPSIAFKTVDGLEEMNRRTNEKEKSN